MLRAHGCASRNTETRPVADTTFAAYCSEEAGDCAKPIEDIRTAAASAMAQLPAEAACGNPIARVLILSTKNEPLTGMLCNYHTIDRPQ